MNHGLWRMAIPILIATLLLAVVPPIAADCGAEVTCMGCLEFYENSCYWNITTSSCYLVATESHLTELRLANGTVLLDWETCPEVQCSLNDISFSSYSCTMAANLIDSLALVGLVLYCISFILGRVIEAKIVRRSTDIDAFDGLPMLPSEAGIVKARTCSTCGVPMGEGASPSHRVCSMCYALESIKESSLLGAVMAPLAVGMWIIGFAPVFSVIAGIMSVFTGLLPLFVVVFRSSSRRAMFGGGLWSRHSGHEEESGILLSNLREAGQLDSDSQAWLRALRIEDFKASIAKHMEKDDETILWLYERASALEKVTSIKIIMLFILALPVFAVIISIVYLSRQGVEAIAPSILLVVLLVLISLRALMDTLLPKQCYVITNYKVMILNRTIYRNVLVGVLHTTSIRHVSFLAVSDHVNDNDDEDRGILGEGRVGFVAEWLDPQHELDQMQKKGVMAGALIEFDLPLCGIVKKVMNEEPFNMVRVHHGARFKFGPNIRRLGPNLLFIFFFICWVAMNGVVLWVIIRDSNWLSLAIVVTFDLFWIPFSLQMRRLFKIAFGSVGLILARQAES